MDGDVERSAAVDDGADSSDARPHINPSGYPLGLIASVATGVFGGASHQNHLLLGTKNAIQLLSCSSGSCKFSLKFEDQWDLVSQLFGQSVINPAASTLLPPSLPRRLS